MKSTLVFTTAFTIVILLVSVFSAFLTLNMKRNEKGHLTHSSLFTPHRTSYTHLLSEATLMSHQSLVHS